MTKSGHNDQRIGVFVDVQNMYYSARQLYKQKVNFNVVLKEAIAGRQLIRAIAYVIKADFKDEGTFYDALSEMGFEVKSKDLQVFSFKILHFLCNKRVHCIVQRETQP